MVPPSTAPRFALNHMAAPKLPPRRFFALARALGLREVEIRNDLAGNAILDGTPAAEMKAAAAEAGVAILTINALQRFNEWTAERGAEAEALADYAADCGASALVLVPVNDGTGRSNGERQGNLRIALKGLRPILKSRGLLGFVEPLGFEICSLRYKSEAADAIRAVDDGTTFRLVHDTFHHHLAHEDALFPDLTGLVHISGVADPDVNVADMRDPHRVLVDEHDRLGNVEQIASLVAAGVDAPFSVEPFAPSVHGSADIARDLKGSFDFIRSRLALKAA